MDFSSVNLENRVLPSSKILSQTTNNRSDFLKRMRSGFSEEQNLLTPKLPKTHNSDVMQQGSSPLLSLSTGTQTKMLSFSNPGSESHSLTRNEGLSQILEFPHYGYTVNTGYGSGVVHAPVMDCGPFTASQWVELQHQALVYKYIQANVAVPSSLLLGIKRPASPYLFSDLNSGVYSYTPNTWGWGGSFHLGFSGNNTDPEPGRCRRTDGKKWRCSRDAVLEQKYCERHLNRGRHRSRKLVEGRSGQAAAVLATATSAPVASRRDVLSQLKGSQTRTAADDGPFGSCLRFDRMADDQSLSGLNPAKDSKSKDSIFSIPNHSRSDFGLVSSDPFLNPSLKTSYTNTTTGFDPIMMDGSDHATWPGGMNPDWTQLSMSIPTSSSPSPPRDKITLSPLSVSWESSLGGPLGEVLLNNPNNNGSWFGSSPTGVLQKADFRSLSNSSSGSSPRGERNKMEDDVFGTHLTTSMFLPPS